jgi:hypothetical protein
MNNEEELDKTWFVDLDGTVLKHHTNSEIDNFINNYGEESHLEEIPLVDRIRFFRNLPKSDVIIITTARLINQREHTIRALNHWKMPYNDIIFDIPSGPRIVVNDIKPPLTAGNKHYLDTAYALNVDRNVDPLKNSEESDIEYIYRGLQSKIKNQVSGLAQEKQLIQELVR